MMHERSMENDPRNMKPFPRKHRTFVTVQTHRRIGHRRPLYPKQSKSEDVVPAAVADDSVATLTRLACSTAFSRAETAACKASSRCVADASASSLCALITSPPCCWCRVAWRSPAPPDARVHVREEQQQQQQWRRWRRRRQRWVCLFPPFRRGRAAQETSRHPIG